MMSAPASTRARAASGLFAALRLAATMSAEPWNCHVRPPKNHAMLDRRYNAACSFSRARVRSARLPHLMIGCAQRALQSLRS